MPVSREPSGVGLGFRIGLAEAFLDAPATNAQFIEIAPENYLQVGGQRARWLAMAAERFPVVSHGLCGDFSGAAPLDRELLTELKGFLHAHQARWYSDHLCFTHVAGAESHDLLALPHNDEAVRRAAKRIREVRDILELPIAIENVSAYIKAPGGTMSEAEFVRAVVEDADCQLLLDINNVYVNSINFKEDADAFIDAMPLDRVIQMHVAGHDVEIPGELVVDTHGAPIVDPVYALLDRTLAKMKRAPPILLERDHNIPPLPELEGELARLREIAGRWL